MKWFRLSLMLLIMSVVIPVAYASAQGNYIMDGADPSMIRQDGVYYSVQSDDNGIHLRQSGTLFGLNSFSTQTTVWWKPSNLQQIWAPEIAKINNEYWIFFAASEGSSSESFDELNKKHRTYALRSTTGPGGSYDFMGKVPLPDDKWSIDTAFVSYDFKHYLVWSGWAGDTNGEQNLYIAQVDLNNPMKMLTGRHIISQPRESWERKDTNATVYVNEGPQPIVRDGRLVVAYSANGSWGSNYCIGYIRLKSGGDPLNVTHYAKSDSCKFQSNSLVLGPGHHSWVMDGLNGTGQMAYHGVPSADNTSRGWWDKRVIMSKGIYWTTEDMWHSWESRWDSGPVPKFGTPLDPHTTMEASNVSGNFIRHKEGRGRIDSNVDPYQDKLWKVHTGLADRNFISFESVNFPGNFLRHRNGEIWLDSNNGSSGFKADATWRRKAGLADSTKTSYESYNFPGSYMRHRFGLLYSEGISTTLDKADATFIER
jgi:GH43 family beta-xylosidase